MELENTIIFVDHANVFIPLSIKEGRIDWKKFTTKLSEGSHKVGMFIYVGEPKKKTKQLKKFYTYLQKIGFIIQPKHILETPSGQRRQKGIEVFMYKDITELAEEDSYDKTIIVSGDADLLDAIKDLKKLQKNFEVWSFKGSLSCSLIEEAGDDHIHYIDAILSDIQLKDV